MSRRPSLKKTLGQHHLVNGGLCRPLVEFLSPLRGIRVLEIGPGGGVLTAELLRAGADVLAWEVDPEWAFVLGHRFQAVPAGESTRLTPSCARRSRTRSARNDATTSSP